MSRSLFEQLLAPQTLQVRERSVSGLVTAIVQSIEGDGMYRLKYLHWGDDEPSAQARVMVPMAGSGSGMHFLPEVGDEVVVAFEMGDTNFPIILGAVWNRVNPPPKQAETSPENHKRTIVSRSGHELTFDDTPGSQKVMIKTQGGHEFVLDDLLGLGEVKLESRAGCSLTFTELPVPSATLQVPGATITMNATGITIQGLTVSLLTIPGGVSMEGKPTVLHSHTPPVVSPPGTSTGPVSPA